MTISDDEMRDIIIRLNGHDHDISKLSLAILGNSELQIVGLTQQVSDLTKQLRAFAAWQHDIKLLARIGVVLLGLLTVGGAVVSWPSLLHAVVALAASL